MRFRSTRLIGAVLVLLGAGGVGISVLWVLFMFEELKDPGKDSPPTIADFGGALFPFTMGAVLVVLGMSLFRYRDNDQ